MVFFNDLQMKNEVIAKLSTDERIDSSGIRVEVNDGVVKLAGTVPSATEVALAFAAAAVVSGDANIVDALNVAQPGTPDLTADGHLKVSLNRILAAEPEIDPSRIKVMVQDGRVTLEGSVDAGWKKSYVEALVERCRNVTGVDSALTVVPTKGAADQATADDLVHALERHPLVGAHDLVVRVENGAVTLSGSVASETAREAAKLMAAHIFGVTDVSDEISVVEPEIRSAPA